MNQPRLIPLVVVAAVALLGLKGVHLLTAAAGDRSSMAAGDDGAVDPITTGSGAGAPPSDAHGAPPAADGHGAKDAPPQTKITITNERPPEAQPIPGRELLSEIAVLQKLAERRKQLEMREKEIDVREGLLKATEGNLGKRIEELKTIEGAIGGGAQSKEEEKSKEITDLVKMYEAMKAKDAARVFDRLETRLLVDIARQMSPRRLADVVSKMSPEAAEKLTVELANRRTKEAPPAPGRELPKIEGRGS